MKGLLAMNTNERRPPDPALIFEKCGHVADPWQIDVLRTTERRLLLNCCRQAGKSTTVAFLALYRAIRDRGTTTLLVSASHRQAQELFRKVRYFLSFVRLPAPKVNNRSELCLTNGSRIVALPCQDETIRGYSGVNLLVLDEAARVPDDVFFAVRPMLATSGGTIICMSTPNGPAGFFWEAATKFAKRGQERARAGLGPAQRPLGRGYGAARHPHDFSAACCQRRRLQC